MSTTYQPQDRVEHVQTGSLGTVGSPQDDATGTVEVLWDPNEHGGFIGKHNPHEIAPLEA